MADPTPPSDSKAHEQQPIDEMLVKKLYGRMSKLIQDREIGKKYDTSNTWRTTSFIIDHREDPESTVNGETVQADYSNQTGPGESRGQALFEKYPDDNWLHVHIQPRDPYRSMIGKRLNSELFDIEAIEYFISSSGLAFELTHWSGVPGPDFQKKFPKLGYDFEHLGLKEVPENPVQLPPETANKDAFIITPLQPLHKMNFARLNFVAEQAERGNTIN